MDPPILVLLQFCVRSTLGDKLKHPRSEKGQEKDGNSFFVERIRGGMHGMRPRKKKNRHQPTSLPNKREKKQRTNCPGKLVHLWKGSLFGDFNAVVVAFLPPISDRIRVRATTVWPTTTQSRLVVISPIQSRTEIRDIFVPPTE